MPRESLKSLTESMLYVLMALQSGPRCGTEIADAVERITAGRLRLGPATLYTILGKFEKGRYICETQVQGRRRTYQITAAGQAAYREEVQRLQRCVADAQREGGEGR